MRIAVIGAGIYGATIAVRLARRRKVSLFDPLGVMQGSSGLNQFRVHHGYHYPRSPETIREIVESRALFIQAYREAIVPGTRHHYAIPHRGSLTSPERFEAICAISGLPIEPVMPRWIDRGTIAACYRVDEPLYDPSILRAQLQRELGRAGVTFVREAFRPEQEAGYDLSVHCTYGRSAASSALFAGSRRQIAEKVRVALPAALHGIGLVVIDGPFTAFDPLPGSPFFQFASASFTNHWTTTDARRPFPERYAGLIDRPAFRPVPFTRFAAMREHAAQVVPACREARYLGSRFTVRHVEDDPTGERRVLRIRQVGPRAIHVFSAKVVGAVRAARRVEAMVEAMVGARASELAEELALPA